MLKKINTELSFLPQLCPLHRRNLYVFSCCERSESYFCDARKYRCVLPEIKPVYNEFNSNYPSSIKQKLTVRSATSDLWKDSVGKNFAYVYVQSQLQFSLRNCLLNSLGVACVAGWSLTAVVVFDKAANLPDSRALFFLFASIAVHYCQSPTHISLPPILKIAPFLFVVHMRVTSCHMVEQWRRCQVSFARIFPADFRSSRNINSIVYPWSSTCQLDYQPSHLIKLFVWLTCTLYWRILPHSQSVSLSFFCIFK